MIPFPEPKSEPLEFNSTLQEAFDQALEASAEPPTEAPIAIVAIDPLGAPHGFAGQLQSEVHYSASLLKMAFMYAGFELQEAARQRLAELELTPAEGLPTVEAEFDEAILENRVPQLENLAKQFLLPRYSDLFEISSASGELKLSEAFLNHLEIAFLEISNPDAGKCIHAIGFGYLTKAMAEAGLLDPFATEEPETADGIWLAGDFGSGYPPQRIDSVNDGAVAQATSAHQMARLLTLLLDRKLVSGKADAEMMDVLGRAAENNLVHLSKAPNLNFRTTASKIGIGSLKTGQEVLSEGLVIEENETSRLFVVVFQNFASQSSSSVFRVSEIVNRTIANFP